MILDLFTPRPVHQLCDTAELKRTLGALLAGEAFKAIEEIYAWFESLRRAEGIRPAQLFDIVRQLDEVGYHKVRRLTRDYLNASRLSKGEERRLWSMCFNYWGELASLYAYCAEQFQPALRNKADKSEQAGQSLNAVMLLLLSRQMAARTNQLRWMIYSYSVIGEDLWRGLGHAFSHAVAGGFADEPVLLYPGTNQVTSVAREYLHLLILSASSADSLMPLEIDLADRLIGYLLPHFVFSETFQKDSVYWVDLAEGKPPIRLAREPATLTPTLRFFSPGTAHQALGRLIQRVEQGEIPEELNVGGNCSAEVILSVMRHLALYWAPEPPLRQHPRHSVKTRIAVLQGFDDCFTLFSGEIARFGKEQAAAVWVVENVSIGGFLASVEIAAEGPKIGTLLGLQSEGSGNWMLGIIRRFSKETTTQANVGIQALSRQAWSVRLRPTGGGFSPRNAVPGICLEEHAGESEIRIAVPLDCFDARENIEFTHDDRHYMLTPIALEEVGVDFEIARYRFATFS